MGGPPRTTRYLRRKMIGHPLADSTGCVRVHRAVLWDKIGPGWHACHWCKRRVGWFATGIKRLVADHLNEDRWDNRPENLVPACRKCNTDRARRPDFLTHCEKGPPLDSRDGVPPPRHQRPIVPRLQHRARTSPPTPEESDHVKHVKRPCDACPWRKDAEPGRFGAERWAALAASSPDDRGFGPEFGSPLFACHKTAEGAERACAGWLVTEGTAHPNVRIALMTGSLPECAVERGENWPDLHESFHATRAHDEETDGWP